MLDSARFRDLSRHTVDTNPKGRVCEARYLCGGACRAWGGEGCQLDLDALPPECAGLHACAAALAEAGRRFPDDKPTKRSDEC